MYRYVPSYILYYSTFQTPNSIKVLVDSNSSTTRFNLITEFRLLFGLFQLEPTGTAYYYSRYRRTGNRVPDTGTSTLYSIQNPKPEFGELVYNF